jgi:hypothetical protein
VLSLHDLLIAINLPRRYSALVKLTFIYLGLMLYVRQVKVKKKRVFVYISFLFDIGQAKGTQSLFDGISFKCDIGKAKERSGKGGVFDDFSFKCDIGQVMEERCIQ